MMRCALCRCATTATKVPPQDGRAEVVTENLDLENDATKWAPRISGKNCPVPKREPRTAARINFGRDRSFAVKFELLCLIKIPPHFCFWIINGRSIRPKAFQSNKKFIQKNISDEKFGSIFNGGQKVSKSRKKLGQRKILFPASQVQKWISKDVNKNLNSASASSSKAGFHSKRLNQIFGIATQNFIRRLRCRNIWRVAKEWPLQG